MDKNLYTVGHRLECILYRMEPGYSARDQPVLEKERIVETIFFPIILVIVGQDQNYLLLKLLLQKKLQCLVENRDPAKFQELLGQSASHSEPSASRRYYDINRSDFIHN